MTTDESGAALKVTFSEVEALQHAWLSEAVDKRAKDVLGRACEIGEKLDHAREKQLKNDIATIMWAGASHTLEIIALKAKYALYKPLDDPVYAALRPFLLSSGPRREALEQFAKTHFGVTDDDLQRSKEAALRPALQTPPVIRTPSGKPMSVFVLEAYVGQAEFDLATVMDAARWRAELPDSLLACAIGPAGDGARQRLEEVRKQRLEDVRKQRRKAEFDEKNREMMADFRREMEQDDRDEQLCLTFAQRIEDRSGETYSGPDIRFTLMELREIWGEANTDDEMPRHWYKQALDLSDPVLKMEIGGEQAYLGLYKVALGRYRDAVKLKRARGTVKKYEKSLTNAYRDLMDRQARGAEAFESAGLVPPPPIPYEPLPEFGTETKGKKKSRCTQTLGESL